MCHHYLIHYMRSTTPKVPCDHYMRSEYELQVFVLQPAMSMATRAHSRCWGRRTGCMLRVRLGPHAQGSGLTLGPSPALACACACVARARSLPGERDPWEGSREGSGLRQSGQQQAAPHLTPLQPTAACMQQPPPAAPCCAPSPPPTPTRTPTPSKPTLMHPHPHPPPPLPRRRRSRR